MRSELLTYLKTQNLGQVTLSQELPYEKDGSPLYNKNFKKLYIDRTNSVQEPLIDLMNGQCIVKQTQTVDCYLTLDAKTSVNNYQSIISIMQAARNNIVVGDTLSRTCSISQEYDGDAEITKFIYQFVSTLTQ